jgi:hypothetical protein
LLKEDRSCRKSSPAATGGVFADFQRASRFVTDRTRVRVFRRTRWRLWRPRPWPGVAANIREASLFATAATTNCPRKLLYFALHPGTLRHCYGQIVRLLDHAARCGAMFRPGDAGVVADRPQQDAKGLAGTAWERGFLRSRFLNNPTARTVIAALRLRIDCPAFYLESSKNIHFHPGKFTQNRYALNL